MLVVGSICPSLPTCCKCTCNKRKADELRGNYDVFRIKLHYWKIQRNCRRTWSCLSKFQSKQLFSFRLQCLKVGGSFFFNRVVCGATLQQEDYNKALQTDSSVRDQHDFILVQQKMDFRWGCCNWEGQAEYDCCLGPRKFWFMTAESLLFMTELNHCWRLNKKAIAGT